MGSSFLSSSLLLSPLQSMVSVPKGSSPGFNRLTSGEVVSEALHQGIKNRCSVPGEKVDGRAVCRETDGFLLLEDPALKRRLS